MLRTESDIFGIYLVETDILVGGAQIIFNSALLYWCNQYLKNGETWICYST